MNVLFQVLKAVLFTAVLEKTISGLKTNNCIACLIGHFYCLYKLRKHYIHVHSIPANDEDKRYITPPPHPPKK